MKINIFIILLSFLIAPVLLKAQSTGDYEKLLNLFGAEQYNAISDSNPELLAKLAFINGKGYHISETGGEKDISHLENVLEAEKIYPTAPDLNENLLLNGELDLLGYNFKIFREDFNYYRIGSTSKMLVILPEKIIEEKFNNP